MAGGSIVTAHSHSLEVHESDGSIRCRVSVKPKARRNSVEGIRAGALIVHVTAAPDKGEANRAVVETLSNWLGVPKSQIEITAGHKSRQKSVCVRGRSSGALEALVAKLT